MGITDLLSLVDEYKDDPTQLKRFAGFTRTLERDLRKQGRLLAHSPYAEVVLRIRRYAAEHGVG